MFDSKSYTAACGCEKVAGKDELSGSIQEVCRRNLCHYHHHHHCHHHHHRHHHLLLLLLSVLRVPLALKSHVCLFFLFFFLPSIIFLCFCFIVSKSSPPNQCL